MNSSKFLTVAAAVGALGISSSLALADGHTKYEDPTGWHYDFYVEGGAGGPIPQDYDVTITPGGPNGVYDPDAGFGLYGAFGLYFAPNWRADVAFHYATAGDGVYTTAAGAVLPHAGDVDAYITLANVYYEFDQFADTGFTPWIGVGLGGVQYDYDNLGAVGGAFRIGNDDTVFAGAFHAGFDFALTEYVDLVGRYTLLLVGDHDVVASNGATVSVDGTAENAFFGGIRIKLSALGLQ